ncbi:MAG TPA: glycosyltransferase family 4 protein [Bryobacteraceae bacterium]|nr:glycosyltransferase family 4 protein [Bryobacteraceae bacterium]
MPRRVLIVHNRYQQAGGEDRVVEAESSLLRKYGHEVFLYVDDNHRIEGMAKLESAKDAIWSSASYRKIRGMVLDHNIELCHFHNTFPLISPAAYYAAARAGAVVVQTLHNYRLLCPGSLLMREDRVCEECVGRTFVWPGAIHRCYRDSYTASVTTVAMLSVHNVMGTWSRKVDRYIALSEFGREKFIRGGLPAEKITVKPNFVDPDPGCGAGEGGYALFAGRLSPEKGVAALLDAWSKHPEFPELRIAGGGPLAPMVKAASAGQHNVLWLGEMGRAQILEQMRGARFLVCPSTWYECFPLVIVEAFACGLPVIASDLGGLSELVQPGKTGLLFTPGSAKDLSAQVQWALSCPQLVEAMRSNARREYEARYTAHQNYEMLTSIYNEAMRRPAAGAVRTRPAAA